MEERGLLFGATAFATRAPSFGTSLEKSVISLFKRKPLDHLCEPKALSMVAVIETAFPWRSIIDKWVVPAASSVLSLPHDGSSSNEFMTIDGSP